MAKRTKKTPRDINSLAAFITEQSTGVPVPIISPDTPQKNPQAQASGHLGGLKGGNVRAEKLSAEERQEIARKAAKARWGK